MNYPTPILHETAFRICLDWLRADNFKDRVGFETFRSASTLWQKIEYDRQHSGRTLWEQDQQLMIEAIKHAHEKGWIQREFSKMGRPRTKDFSPQQQAEAEYKLNHHLAESTMKRLHSQAGEYQPDFYSVLTVTDRIFEEWLGTIDPQQLQNISRDELLNLTGFNPKVNNRLYNWLRQKGWSERRASRTSEMGVISRVRVLWQEDVQF